jgi:hypothetical protein
MRLQRSPIWIAVVCLSPVSIHTLIPAFLSNLIVSGTPSYQVTTIYEKENGKHAIGQVIPLIIRKNN